MAQGVKEGVKSECLPVMGKIGIVIPTRKGADLLLVLHGDEGSVNALVVAVMLSSSVPADAWFRCARSAAPASKFRIN